MAEAIIDGIGSGYYAQVDNTNRLMVRTEGITVGSLSVAAGSEVYVKGGSILTYSGTNYVDVSNTVDIVGSVAITSPISVTTGSEVYVKGGSILNYSGTNYVDLGNFGDLGSDRTISNRVAGSVVNLPDVTISNPETIGSYPVQTVLGSVAITSPISVSTGSEVYIKGGSVLNYSGTNYVDVSNTVDILGSVAITSPISVSTGSEVYVKGGSIHLYSGTTYADVANLGDLGSSRVVENFGDLGSSRVVTNFGDLGSDRTISNRVAGSIVNWPGSLAVSNFAALGSTVVIDSPETIGSYPVQGVSFTGSTEVYSSTGSVEVYGSLSATAGSESWIKGGSIHLYSGTTYSDVANFGDLGSTVVIDSPASIGSYTTQGVSFTGSTEVYSSTGSVEVYGTLSATAGSESWVKGGSIHLYSQFSNGYKQAISITAGSEAIWVPGAGSKAIITDITVSIGSPTNEVAIYAGGSTVFHTYLAENGGFVTNLQTPFETQTNGSVWFETSTIGSANLTLTGYERV